MCFLIRIIDEFYQERSQPEDLGKWIEGYANNKLVPGTDIPAKDSFGDIPTGDNVYDITRLKLNSVMLTGHDNEPFKIMGNFFFLEEDKQGLKFKAALRPKEEIHHPETKDAVSAFETGFAKALSIGGMFYYDWGASKPDENTFILVKAVLHEISGVGVGADPFALVSDLSKNQDDIKKIEEEIEKYIDTGDTKHLDKALEIGSAI